MLSSLMRTADDRVLAVLRITLGVVMFPHAAQKVFGWFGGFGPSATLGYFESLGIPALLGILVIAAEFLGALGLIFGALTRVAALGIGAVMIGAVLTVHLPNGFFMNWSGGQAGEGFEYHLLVLAMVLMLVVRGGGALSVDRLLAARRPAD